MNASLRRFFSRFSRFHTDSSPSTVWLFVIVILIAAAFRFWNLADLPHGFHSDEVMNGYVGRYILETGKDLYGNPWPLLYFDHFGDYPNVIPMYWSGLSVWLFGSSVWAVRFPIALAGVLTAAVAFALSRWLWKSPWIAFFSGLLVAIFPWHILLSRATAEIITGSLVFLSGFFLMWRSIETKKLPGIFLSFLVLLFTYLLYPSFRIIVPLALLPTVLFAHTKRLRIVLATCTVLAFCLTMVVSKTYWGQGRFEQTSFLAPNKHIQTRSIQYSSALGEGRVLEARTFYNRYVLTGKELLRQYASYFSPEFLLSKNGLPPRYVFPEQTLLFWTPFAVLAAAILLQFIFPWRKKEVQGLFREGRGKYFLWLGWLLLLAPIPAALTYNDVPNIHRAALESVLFPLLLAPAAYFVARTRFPFKKIVLSAFVVTLCVEVLLFWQVYARMYPTTSGYDRQDEQIQLATWLKENADRYERVYVPGNEVMPLFYLFVQNSYPSELAGQFSYGISVPRIGNVYFVESHCPSLEREVQEFARTNPGSVVAADRSECESSPDFALMQTIRHKDTTSAYDLLQMSGKE